MTNNKDLKQQIERQAQRMRQAEHDRPTLLAQTTYLGSLGLMLVLPIIIGAYLGRWLDDALAGYSVSWTTSLIVVGVFVGGLNVWLMIRDKE